VGGYLAATCLGADVEATFIQSLGTPHVITLDRRHFHAVRPRHCEALHLLPE
jgi:hypothetical protein